MKHSKQRKDRKARIGNWQLAIGNSPQTGSAKERNVQSVQRPHINVRNRQRIMPVNVRDLEKFAAKVVRSCLRLPRRRSTDLTGLSEIFVWLVSDRRMATLHRQFLHQTGPTDVLTFQHGEIFISVETARRNGSAFGNSLAHELRLYIVHGFLHLHGFDDQKPANARKMEKVQKRILTETAKSWRRSIQLASQRLNWG